MRQAALVADGLRDEFLQDLASAVLHWEDWVDRELAIAARAPSEIAREAIRGVVHSLLVTIDGGTALSDRGRRVWLTDGNGESVGEGLHEYLFHFLPDAP